MEEFVSVLHTFARDLKWNPHIHMLITEGASGNFTVWRHFKHSPYTMLRKKVVESVSAIDFIKKLIIHIQDEQFKTVRYYGLYAKKHKHKSKLFMMTSNNAIKVRKLLSHWRERIQLTFGYDPIACSCGNKKESIEIFLPTKKVLVRPPPKLYNYSS